MKIVIDIPEEQYEYWKAQDEEWLLAEVISKGIVLPKGHGRLIDADALRKNDEVTEWLSINPIRTGKNLKMFSELFVKKIDEAPTIIEAEGGEE